MIISYLLLIPPDEEEGFQGQVVGSPPLSRIRDTVVKVGDVKEPMSREGWRISPNSSGSWLG